MTLGEKIRDYRNSKNLSRITVADRLALSDKTYAKIENDEKSPSYNELKMLAEIFEISMNKFLPAEKQTVNIYDNENPIINIAETIQESNKNLQNDLLNLQKQNQEMLSFMKDIFSELVQVIKTKS